MNKVEEDAEQCEYLADVLPSYEGLWGAVEGKRRGSAKGTEEYWYWSAYGKLLYAVFDTLYYLWWQSGETVEDNDRKFYRRAKSLEYLSEGSALLCLGYVVQEYVRRLVDLNAIEGRGISRETLMGGIHLRSRETRSCKALCCLQKGDAKTNEDARSGEGEKLSELWDGLWKANELRMVLTHRFRLPWNKNCARGEFGYPASLGGIFDGRSEDELKDLIDGEIWSFIADDKGWNEKVRGASAEEFVSGREMVRGLHDSHARFCEKLFAVLLRDIEGRASRQPED